MMGIADGFASPWLGLSATFQLAFKVDMLASLARSKYEKICLSRMPTHVRHQPIKDGLRNLKIAVISLVQPERVRHYCRPGAPEPRV